MWYDKNAVTSIFVKKTHICTFSDLIMELNHAQTHIDIRPSTGTI